MERLIQLLQSGGVGGVIAVILEKTPWFQNLSPNTKFWVAVLTTGGSALALRAAVIYVPQEVWAELDPWITVSVSSILGSQLIHRLVNKDNTIKLDEQTIRAIKSHWH